MFFDILFFLRCCPISARISVSRPSVSHESEVKEKRKENGRRRGCGCLVLPSFQISPVDIISAAPSTMCEKQIWLSSPPTPPSSPPPSPPSPPPPPFIVHPFPAPTGQAINGPLIFTTAAKAHAEDSTTDKTNIPSIFSCAFKMKVATRGPPGDGGRGVGGTCEPLTFISSRVIESLIDLLQTIN